MKEKKLQEVTIESEIIILKNEMTQEQITMALIIVLLLKIKGFFFSIYGSWENTCNLELCSNFLFLFSLYYQLEKH